MPNSKNPEFQKLPPDRFTRKQAAAYLGISLSTEYRWRKEGLGPPFIPLAGKIFYSNADLDAFLNSKKRRKT